MKWTGIFLVGYFIFIAGILGALWKLGILANIGTAWTLIGIMLAVSNSGSKENIEINRK